MDNKKVLIKLTVAHAKCSDCGFERILYFMSDYSYRERLVSTKDGKLCAYANLLEEKIIPELSKYCQEVLLEMNITISKNKLGRIVSNIYGITCDSLEGEDVDNSPNWKCNNCIKGKMEEDKIFGERIMEMEVPYVRHSRWMHMDEERKKQVILEELIKQGYI